MTNLIYDTDLNAFVPQESRDGRSSVSARTAPRIAYNSRNQENAFSWTANYLAGADDLVLFLRNTHAEKRLFIDNIEFGSDADAVFTVKRVTGTASGTNHVTGFNLNFESTEVADCVCKCDPGGTQTDDGIVRIIRCKANSSEVRRFDGYILDKAGPSKALAIYVNVAANVNVTVTGYFQ